MNPETSTLVIVSHVTHFEWQGGVWAYGPYAREIDIWCDLFAQVAIAAPVAHTQPPDDAARIGRDNVSVRPQIHAGGDSLRDKVVVLAKLPLMALRLAAAMRGADAIHVRCPGNLGLLGILVAPLFSRRLVAKYAGQWGGYPGEAGTYRLQRRLLRSWWWRGIVTVYGDWPNQPPKVVPFFTSVLDDDQVARARRSAMGRFEPPKREATAGNDRGRPRTCLSEFREASSAGRPQTMPVGAGKPSQHFQDSLGSQPQTNPDRRLLRLLFVGRLSRAKNVDAVIDAVHQLDAQAIAVRATLVGDGPERDRLEDQARRLGVDDRITFTGGIAFDDVLTAYEQHDVLVLVSQTEGWPKAIAESMAFGLVAIGSNRGLVPEILGEGRGLIVEPGDAAGLAAAVAELASAPARRVAMIRNAAAWGQRYSLQTLRTALGDVLAERWAVPRATFRDHTKTP